MTWKYVGEAGAELKSRNSHSLGVVSCTISDQVHSFLVVYGGASPEEGPMGQTYYATLPADPNTIGEYLISFVCDNIRETSSVKSRKLNLSVYLL
jgi:hypothetical protein